MARWDRKNHPFSNSVKESGTAFYKVPLHFLQTPACFFVFTSDLMKLFCLVTAAGSSICLAYLAAPHVIYMLADDFGYGDLSCYGQTKLSIPNIDRLASEGIKFTDHYSGNAVCSPDSLIKNF